MKIIKQNTRQDHCQACTCHGTGPSLGVGDINHVNTAWCPEGRHSLPRAWLHISLWLPHWKHWSLFQPLQREHQILICGSTQYSRPELWGTGPGKDAIHSCFSLCTWAQGSTTELEIRDLGSAADCSSLWRQDSGKAPQQGSLLCRREALCAILPGPGTLLAFIASGSNALVGVYGWKGNILFQTNTNLETKRIYLCNAEKTCNILRTVSLSWCCHGKTSSGSVSS